MPNDATGRKTTPNFCVENKQRHFVIKVSPHVMSEVNESSNESSKMTVNTQYAAGNVTKNPKNSEELDENCKTYFTTYNRFTTYNQRERRDPAARPVIAQKPTQT